jgi:hypothetical protein
MESNHVVMAEPAFKATGLLPSAVGVDRITFDPRDQNALTRSMLCQGLFEPFARDPVDVASGRGCDEVFELSPVPPVAAIFVD